MNPLTVIDSWPVGRAAAAVVGPSGVLALHGDTATPFRLASLTKPLTALAVAVAVEEGALAFSDEITAVTGELPGATVGHLLAHASGMSPERRVRAAAPGTRRIYSNAGFDVLGELTEAATDIAFADYLRESVFMPLSMTTASLEGSPARDGSASVTDIGKVLAELLNPAGFLHPSTVTAMTSIQFPGLRGVLPGYGQQLNNDWGLGFEIRANKSPHWTGAGNNPATYGHFGQSGTMFWIDPVAQLGLVALSDRNFDEWAVRAWPALSDIVLDSFA